MHTNEIAANMLSAVVKELDAVESKATVTIEMILFRSVGSAGIADHTSVLDEIAMWAQRGAEARDAKTFLIDKFTQPEKVEDEK